MRQQDYTSVRSCASTSKMKILCQAIIFIIMYCDLSAQQPADINLLVDANLADPVRALVMEYVEGNYVNVATQLVNYNEVLNFITSDTDVVITANEDAVAFLQDKGLIDGTVCGLAKDRLLLLSHADPQHEFSDDFAESLRALSKYTNIIITDKHSTLSGRIAMELLLSIGVKNMIEVQNQEKAVELIKRGKGFGLLFGSGVADLQSLSFAPVGFVRLAKYQALILKAQSSERVTSFLKFILLNDTILKKSGLVLAG